MRSGGLLESWARWTCTHLLRLWPGEFRRLWGADLQATFLARFRTVRARGRIPALLHLLRAAGDLCLGGIAERCSTTLPRSLRPMMFYAQDLRYALRLLARSPLFTLLTVMVLGGGLGVSVFTFSFLHTAALRPLPVEDGDRIVRLLAVDRSGATGLLDAADLARIRPQITTLTDVGGYAARAMVVGEGSGFALQATVGEWQILDAVRGRAALGRGFVPGDADPGAEPVVVLSHRIWRAALGEDPAAVGTRIPLNGVPTRIIGVMPEGFGFPVAADAWIPAARAAFEPALPGRLRVDAYGRLREGVSARAAQAELSVLIQRARNDTAPALTRQAAPAGVAVRSFPMSQIGSEGPLVLAGLNAAALLILLLACVNVTNLLLARANERDREIAVRLALGASRPRLIMQSMWETVILCLLGGALATALAALALEAVDTWARVHLEGNLAFWWRWGFDRTVLLAAGGFVTLAMVILGAVVSVRASRTRLSAVLNDGAIRAGGRQARRWSRGLVVAQVAAVTVLLYFGAMAALIGQRVVHVDLGYETRNLLTARLALPEDRYRNAREVSAALRALADALAQRPELDGVVLQAELGRPGRAGGVEVAGRPAAPEARPEAFVVGLLGSLAPLGIAVEEGRGFEVTDGPDGAPTALVSRSFADRHWPGVSPLGRQLRITDTGATAGWRTVVGVVGDVMMGNPLSRDRSAEAVYLPLEQVAVRDSRVLIRHKGHEPAGRGALLETLVSLDPQLVPDQVAGFEEILAKSTLIARSVTRLFTGAVLFALLLALTGTYGLMARSIGQRTREIGVRRALGATDAGIVGLLLRDGVRQLGVGALIALPLTVLLGLAVSKLFPVGRPVAVGLALLVSAAVTVVVLSATWVPTRRAVRIPPRDALTAE